MAEYTFVKELPDDYQCMICAKLLNEPHLTDCCGQHFCQACLEQWFKKQGKKICPHCRSETFSHISYIPLKRKIDDLEVYCPNQNEGCKETTKLGELNSHKNVCGFARVMCTQECGKMILRKDLTQHCIDECSKRQTICIYCGLFDHFEYINGKHVTVCEEYPVNCPRGCTQSSEIKRKDLKKHTEVCPLEKVQCPFSEAGCDASVLRKDLSTHIETSGQQHLMLMMTAYNKLKEDFKQMSLRVASVPPVEPVKLTAGNDRFSFIITSTKGWISPPFCVPGGYKFYIKHNEGKMASLMLFRGKYNKMPMDSQHWLKIFCTLVAIDRTSVSATLVTPQPSDEKEIVDLDLNIMLREREIQTDDIEIARITMLEEDFLKTNVTVKLHVEHMPVVRKLPSRFKKKRTITSNLRPFKSPHSVKTAPTGGIL